MVPISKICLILGLFVTILGPVVGCAPTQTQVSGRPPGLFDKQMGPMTGNARLPGGSTSRPEMYIRRKDVKIEPKVKENTTGSLYNPTDERNNLFVSAGPVSIGRYISVKVASNRVEKAAEPSAAKPEAAKAEGDDDVTSELLTALPNLTPADPTEANIVKRFEMKIAHRYDNGDALVTMQRKSLRDTMANEVTISGRVPYEALVSGDQITTDDLNEVRFMESMDGELTERMSSGWEDEYTLRMSGFDEAKSKVAQELEDKRKSLEDTRESLETRIKTMGQERRKVAEERERVAKKSELDNEKMQGMESTISEQKETIKEQEDIIQELQPEDKAGDNKDGSDGA